MCEAKGRGTRRSRKRGEPEAEGSGRDQRLKGNGVDQVCVRLKGEGGTRGV